MNKINKDVKRVNSIAYIGGREIADLNYANDRRRQKEDLFEYSYKEVNIVIYENKKITPLSSPVFGVTSYPSPQLSTRVHTPSSDGRSPLFVLHFL